MRAIGVSDDRDLALYNDLSQGVSARSPSRVNVGTPHWLTDRQMQDLIGQVARGAGAHVAPKTPRRMMTAFDHVLDAPLEDRLSKTLSWLSDWRRAGVFGKLEPRSTRA